MLKFDWNFLVAIINVVVFFILMRVFLFKPIKRVLDKRKELISKQLQDAQDAETKAMELKKQYEEKMDGANDESQKIISDAKENAKEEYARIIEKAETDAEKLMSSAKKQAQAERENEIRLARESIANLAMDAAEKVVGASVSDKTNSDIFDEFLNESSDDNGSENQ